MSYTNVISLLPIRFRNKYIVLKSYKAEGFIMARDSIKDGRNGSFRIRSNGRVECRFRYIDEFGRTKVKSISGGNVVFLYSVNIIQGTHDDKRNPKHDCLEQRRPNGCRYTKS